MTTKVFSTSVFRTDGNDAYLYTGPGPGSAWVMAGVVVSAESANGIEATGAQTTVRVDGNVNGGAWGILLGSGATSHNTAWDNRVIVAAGGSVGGIGPYYGGVAISGMGSSVSNAGTIYGGKYGVYLNGVTGYHTSEVINSGLIDALEYGVWYEGSDYFSLRNSGTINGGVVADNTTSRQTIINTGTINGNVTMGQGDDFYDGRRGHVDYIGGGEGNDTIYGGSDDEYIYGGGHEGVDIIRGGGGHDTIDSSNGANSVADYSDQTRSVEVSLSDEEVISVIGGLEEDTLVAVLRVYGGSAGDRLEGDQYNNLFKGKAGADVLLGGDGNDTLNGGTGKDIMDGGAGRDLADYSDRSGAVVVTLNGSTTVTVSVGGKAEDSIKNIEDVTGGTGADKLTGDSKANKLIGGTGADTLIGGAGDDFLLDYDKGVWTGGTGKDIFQFGSPGQAGFIGTITDFSHADDTFYMESRYYSTKTALGSTMFRANASGHAGDADDYVIYDKSNGELWMDRDAGGNIFTATKVAQLGTVASHPMNLDYTDFFYV